MGTNKKGKEVADLVTKGKDCNKNDTKELSFWSEIHSYLCIFI